MTVDVATSRPADAGASDEELLRLYGPFLEGAIVAYRTDPTYLVEMAEKAAVIAARRVAAELVRAARAAA